MVASNRAHGGLLPSLLIASLYATSASATVIWDESVNGDLSLTSNLGALGLGTNTIFGTGSFLRSGGGAVTADVDSGIFSLGYGLSITSVSAEITGTHGYGATLGVVYTDVISPALERIFQVDMVSGLETVDLLPYFAHGDFQFFTGGGSSSVDDNVDFQWDWKIDITTRRVSVPEPGTLSLLGAGLLGVLLGRRRKAAIQ